MEEVYVKTIPKETLHNILREVSAIRICRDFPGIVQIANLWEDESGYNIATLNAGKQLYNTIFDLNHNQILSYVSQILTVLSYCHGMGIYHRDIKPDNIVVENDNITIIDFGNARHKVSSDIVGDIKTTGSLVSYASFAAPESLQGDNSFLDKVDEWAVGVVLYMMITKQEFVNGEEDVLMQVNEKLTQGLNLYQYTDDGKLVTLCTKLLVVNSMRRWSCDQALSYLGLNIPKASPLVTSDIMYRRSNYIKQNSRDLLFEWLEEVRDKFNLMKVTLINAKRLVDNYTQIKNISLGQYQLLGCVCLHLSSYLYEAISPEIEDYIFVSANAYNIKQFKDLVSNVMNTFRFDVDRM